MSRSSSFRGCFWALVFAAGAIVDGRAANPIPFQNGSLIDLMTVKGADAAASDNMQGPPSYNPATALLHRSFGSLRFDNKFHECWWELKLPDTYKVSKVRVIFQQVTSVAFTVKVATEEPNNWDAVSPAATFNGPVPEIMPNTPGPGAITVEFPPVDGKFVRIDIKGNNGAENGLPPKVLDNVLTLVGVEVWGPNYGLAISPAISAAQYAWAGGSATFHDPTFGGEQDANLVVDDGDPGQNGWPNALGFNAPGSPAAPPASPVPTASIYVTLKNRMMVSSVAYASLAGDRPERPRDVKIYTSLLDRGDSDWTPQKEIKEIKGGDYVEIPFDQPVMAKRVRFEIERIWSPNVNPANHLASGQMVQLYVYGDPLPPDFTYPVADNGGQVGIQVFDKSGGPVRTLQLPDTAAAGTYPVLWDGTDNLGAKLPPGDYECRVVLNPTTYSTMQPIGNTSTTRGQQYPVVVGKENPRPLIAWWRTRTAIFTRPIYGTRPRRISASGTATPANTCRTARERSATATRMRFPTPSRSMTSMSTAPPRLSPPTGRRTSAASPWRMKSSRPGRPARISPTGSSCSTIIPIRRFRRVPRRRSTT